MPPTSTSSSSKPSSHVCPDCGRAYKAAETLNRHRKNHSDTSQYACSVCDAAFKRKDLLDRHAQIHTGNKTATNRSRSHRACDRCSRLKTRCDNLSPCTRCSKGDHECTYKQTRSRARTDRSSASVGSSIHSSPHIQSEELSSIAGTPEEVTAIDSDQSLGDNDGIIDGFWLQDTAWEWPQMMPNIPVLEAEPSSLRTSRQFHTRSNIEPSFVLDPALGSTTTQVPTNPSIPPGAIYDNIPCSDNSSGIIPWYTQTNTQYDSIPVSSNHLSTTNTTSSADPRRTARSHVTTAATWNTPTLLGSAAQIAQEATITELITFCTTNLSATGTTTTAHQVGSRRRFWQSMSSKLELAFNLDGLVPSRDSNIFEHFLDLFYTFFPVSWLTRPTVHITSAVHAFPPHLCLVMAAIGAAYAGPKAEAFHTQVIDALRPRLADVGMQTSLTTEGTFLLIQSLALLLTAMLHLGHRQTLDNARELARLIVELGRRLRLFNEGNNGAGARQNNKRQTAHGIAKLDIVVASLFGTEMLLTDGERKSVDVPSGKRTEDVLDRLMNKSSISGKATAAAEVEKTGWEARWMGSSP